MICKVSKRTKRIGTPVHATTQDVPFHAPSADRTPASFPLTPLDFGVCEGLSHVEGTQTRPSKPSTTSKEDMVIPGQGRTLITSSLSAPSSSLGQNPPFGGARRPSVIVYKVGRGPNLAKSKDVIRISYGEGHQKRIHNKSLGRRNKVRGQGSYSSLQKVLRIVQKGDAAMRLAMKSVRPYFCTTQGCYDMKRLHFTRS